MATYYVDTAADPGGNGTTQALTGPNCAWDAVADVNAASFSANDEILFKCGCTWRESLVVPSSGTEGNPITFSKYGVGANPILDGTNVFADFTLDSGAIWDRATTNALEVKQVFEDGVRMIYKADKASMVVGSFAVETGHVYVWCTDSGNPNTEHTIEHAPVSLGATASIVVQFNGKANLVFDGIDVYRANVSGYCTYPNDPYNADLDGTAQANIEVNNCTVSYTGIRGIVIGTDAGTNFQYPINVTIQNVIGHDDLDHSFWIGHGTNLIVQDCTTYNSGKDVNPNGKLYPNSGTYQHYPDGIMISAEAKNCIVRGNYVHDIYAGFAILDELSGGLHSSGTVIEKNRVDTTLNSIQAVYIAGTNTRVSYNLIQTGSGTGIILGSSPTVPLIYNNTIISASNAGHSIDTGSQPGAVVKNNIITRSGTSNRFISVALAAQTGFVANNNLYYQSSGTARWFWGPTEYTTFATWKSNSGQDANGLNEDPIFVAPASNNFHLNPSSPCVNAGVDVGLSTDFEGKPIVGLPDMGAYELGRVWLFGATH